MVELPARIKTLLAEFGESLHKGRFPLFEERGRIGLGGRGLLNIANEMTERMSGADVHALLAKPIAEIEPHEYTILQAFVFKATFKGQVHPLRSDGVKEFVIALDVAYRVSDGDKEKHAVENAAKHFKVDERTARRVLKRAGGLEALAPWIENRRIQRRIKELEGKKVSGANFGKVGASDGC